MKLPSLKYRGFTADIKFSTKGWIFHGEIQGIRPDSVSFEGRCIVELRDDFHEAVDDYLKQIATRQAK